MPKLVIKGLMPTEVETFIGEASKIIIDELAAKGRLHPGAPATVEIDSDLPDGRRLYVDNFNPSRADGETSPNAFLRISLRAAREDQVGYYTTARVKPEGTDYELEDMRIEFGPGLNDGESKNWTTIYSALYRKESEALAAFARATEPQPLQVRTLDLTEDPDVNSVLNDALGKVQRQNTEGKECYARLLAIVLGEIEAGRFQNTDKGRAQDTVKEVRGELEPALS